MRSHIRGVPELCDVLDRMADACRFIPAPDRDGQPRKWLPCNHCDSIVAVPYDVISTICDDCTAPCAHVGCGLRVYEHVDGCEFEPDTED